jgi:AbrB family looped-hinge helix DNA binding protein
VRVTVSDDFQIVIPEEARRTLEIVPGNRMVLEVRDDCLILVPEPRDYAAMLRGLHSEIWQGIEPQDYVRGEREAWPQSRTGVAIRIQKVGQIE